MDITRSQQRPCQWPNANCLEAVDALWPSNGQAVYVCPYCVFDEDLSTRVFNEPMSLFSSTQLHTTLTTVRSLGRSWRMRRATDSLSLGSIFFVGDNGESCTFVISSDAVFIGAILTALRIKSCLSRVRNLAWSVA